MQSTVHKNQERKTCERERAKMKEQKIINKNQTFACVIDAMQWEIFFCVISNPINITLWHKICRTRSLFAPCVN